MESMRAFKLLSRKPLETRDEVVNYYAAHEQTSQLMTTLRDYGLYRDEHKDFKEMMARLRRLRGKEKKPWRAADKKKK